MSTTIVIPSNPVDQKAILAAIKEASDSLLRIDSEKEHVKAIIEKVAEDYELNKKHIRKMITTYHKQNIEVFESETDDFVALYRTIVGK